MEKRCNVCTIELVVGVNWTAVRQNRSMYRCTSCNTRKAREWRKKTGKNKEYTAKYHAASPKYALAKSASAAHSRAKRKNIPFSLDWRKLLTQWQIDPNCPLCGIDFIWGHSQLNNIVQPNSITIDRIIPDIGYTDENCRIICHRCNSAKGFGSDEDLIEYAKQILKYHRSVTLDMAD